MTSLGLTHFSLMVGVPVVMLHSLCLRYGYMAEPLGSWVAERTGVKVADGLLPSCLLCSIPPSSSLSFSRSASSVPPTSQ